MLRGGVESKPEEPVLTILSERGADLDRREVVEETLELQLGELGPPLAAWTLIKPEKGHGKDHLAEVKAVSLASTCLIF